MLVDTCIIRTFSISHTIADVFISFRSWRFKLLKDRFQRFGSKKGRTLPKFKYPGSPSRYSSCTYTLPTYVRRRYTERYQDALCPQGADLLPSSSTCSKKSFERGIYPPPPHLDMREILAKPYQFRTYSALAPM
jgi:hypothetical protein